MRKAMLALVGALLALGTIAPALAGHEDQRGNSNYGHCKAITNMNENGYNNGKAFRVYDHIEDDDNDGNNFAEAIAYCNEYLSDSANHPSEGGGKKDG